MGILANLIAEAYKAKQVLSAVNSKFIAVAPKLLKAGPAGSDVSKEIKGMINDAARAVNMLVGSVEDAEQELATESVKKEAAGKVKIYNSYASWKAAVKKAGAVRIDGDKDIATALNAQGKGVGEWDGEKGDIYNTSSEAMTQEDDLLIPKQAPVEEDDMDGEYEDSLKDQIGDIILDGSLDDSAKIEKLLALCSNGDESSSEGEIDGEMNEAEEPAISIGDEDEEDMEEEQYELMKTEESLRRTKSNPAVRKLIEEVDAYRARDKRERLVKEAKKFCEASSLPKYSITEAFLGILADSSKKNWRPLIDDRRKVIYRGEAPVSSVAQNGDLTVDSLVKALRS
jgi:hypothetical protein